MKIMILDNYDSFTYNLVHAIEQLAGQKVFVFRNDKISLRQVEAFDKIVLSPGPGIPSEAGVLKALIEEYAQSKSILGVCLGHQAIAEVFGAKLINLPEVYHGIATPMKQTAPSRLFKNISQEFQAGRYHSWIVRKNSLPPDFEVTARDSQDEIMAFEHKSFNLAGVQFHPESVLTPQGEKMLENWLKM